MFRVLQVIAVTVYIVAAIAAVAYWGGAFYWLVPLLAPALYYLFTFKDLTPPGPSAANPPPYRRSPAEQDRIDARIEELKNGPPHRNKTQYIDSIRRGIPYSDDQIDYLELPDRLVLCEHLRPVEAAARAARIPMDNPRPKLVMIGVHLRWPEVREKYNLPGYIRLEILPGGNPHAPPVHALVCSTCGDSLEEFHWAQSLAGSP